MFRMFSNVQILFSPCSEFSVMFSNVQNLFSPCSEFSVMLRLCSEYLAQKLVCSESLDFVVKLLWWYFNWSSIILLLTLQYINRQYIRIENIIINLLICNLFYFKIILTVKYIKCKFHDYNSTYFSNKIQKGKTCYTEEQVISMLEFLIDSIFVSFGGALTII